MFIVGVNSYLIKTKKKKIIIISTRVGGGCVSTSVQFNAEGTKKTVSRKGKLICLIVMFFMSWFCFSKYQHGNHKSELGHRIRSSKRDFVFIFAAFVSCDVVHIHYFFLVLRWRRGLLLIDYIN